MKGAKELAEHCREEAARQFGYFGAEEHRSFLSDIAAHLEAKAAIDSAVPSDANEIEYRWGKSHGDISTLLAIVQRQAGEMAEYRRHAEADTATLNDARIAARAEVERLKAALQAHNPGLRAALSREESAHLATLAELDEARAEVERLKLEVAALKAERDHLATTRMESSAEVDRLQTERIALAQENARLINEVGELHAKLAAPSVDMTPGMQPRAMRESAGCHAGTDGDCYWTVWKIWRSSWRLVAGPFRG